MAGEMFDNDLFFETFNPNFERLARDSCERGDECDLDGVSVTDLTESADQTVISIMGCLLCRSGCPFTNGGVDILNSLTIQVTANQMDIDISFEVD
ncbi:MAG TPA: hypothetical protein VLF39_03450 [Candidatus Saccharimonadales bacterium]|nr:hypothetical protein [Candidatus Saccharimonadales bacterium]